MYLPVALLLLTCAAVAAQNDTGAVEDECSNGTQCCSKEAMKEAISKAFRYAYDGWRKSCDPLYKCIFRCFVGITVVADCPTKAQNNIDFNKWLLTHYMCFPTDILSCLKRCVVYNAYRPCFIIAQPVDDSRDSA